MDPREYLQKWLKIEQALHDSSIPKDVFMPWLASLLAKTKTITKTPQDLLLQVWDLKKEGIWEPNALWGQTKGGVIVPKKDLLQQEKSNLLQQMEIIEISKNIFVPNHSMSKKEVFLPENTEISQKEEVFLPDSNSADVTLIAPSPIFATKNPGSLPPSPTDSFWANTTNAPRKKTPKTRQISIAATDNTSFPIKKPPRVKTPPIFEPVAKSSSPFEPVAKEFIGNMPVISNLPAKYEAARSPEGSTLILPSNTPSPQVALPNYQIVEKLGKYGPGILYRALHKETKEELILEEIRHKNAGCVVPEVMASALLFHPNIINPCQVWLENNVLYIATKFIRGKTLRKYIEDEVPTTDEKVSIMATIGDALCYAHKRGIVHGNFRLSNIIIAEDKTPYLINFGLGKLYSRKNIPHTKQTSYKQLDPKKALSGLPKMSPRPDIRLFGSVFFEIITAKKLNRKNKLRNHGDIPWPGAISPKLKSICLGLLDKKRGYKSLNIAIADIRKYLSICESGTFLPKSLLPNVKEEKHTFRWKLLLGIFLFFSSSTFFIISTLPKIYSPAKEVRAVSKFSKALVKLHHRNKYFKIDAARYLGNMGSDAKTGVSQLVFALNDERWEVKKTILDALAKIDPKGKKTFPLLISTLQHKNDLMRKASAEALDYLYDKIPPNVGAEKALIKATSDAHWPIRLYSLSALEKMGSLKISRFVLLRRIKDKHWSVRRDAIKILGKIGLNSSWPMEHLARAIKDPNKYVRKTAIEKISKIGGPRGTAAIPILLEMLKWGDFTQQRNTLKALGKITPISPEAIPVLVNAMKERDWLIKKYAKEALSQIDSRANGTMNAFMEVLKKENHHIRKYVVIAIGKMTPKKPVMVPALIYALNDSNDFVRKRAVDSLRDYGPLAISAIPFLTKALKDKSFWVRQSAQEAIKRIKGQ